MKNKLLLNIFTPIPVGLFFGISSLFLMGGAGDTGYGMIFVVLAYWAVWLLAIIPAFSVWYASHLPNSKKTTVGFSIYNALVISIGTMALLLHEDETVVIVIILFVWVFLWTLISAIAKQKRRNNSRDS